MNKIVHSMVNVKPIWIGVPIVYLLIFWVQGGLTTFKHPISIIFITILIISIVVNLIHETKSRVK